MKLVANGRDHEVEDGATLGEFLRGLDLDPRYVVVERNGEVVDRTDADDTELEDGDHLVIVRAVAGGAEPRSGEHARRGSGAAATPGVAGGAEPRSGEHARRGSGVAATPGVAGGAEDAERPSTHGAERIAGGAQDAGALPSMSEAGARRMARLEDARLYVVTDARRDRGDLEGFLTAICEASVDVVQLRDKTATEDELRAASDVFRRVCERTGALFVLNDFPGLAVQVGADGVHVGQEDVHPDHARKVVGPDLIVGRSTHGPGQLDAAADEDVDYVAVGPVHETPTKEGRPGIGLDPIRYAAERASHPWFAIGGLNPDTLPPVLEAGARRIVVVRAVCDAAHPAEACWTLRKALAAYHL